MEMELDLQDRAFIVTGASRGIGAATARLLAKEGAKLALVSRDADALDALRAQLPGEPQVIACDMNAADSAERIVQETHRQFGRIDGLVNCAGATSGGDPLTLSEVAWRTSFELKFFATLRLITTVIPVMKAQGRGVVLTIGGNIGRQPNVYMLPGSAVGAALHAINKGLADATAAHGIRFHIFNPGPTRTERLINYAQMLAKQSGITVEQAEQQLVKDAPQRRIADPAEMAAMIVWMLSDRFAAATGNSVTADGGWVKAAS
jgi:NAD(P)-dependent dehydrogenase (short-subunit alcohol dehydrogenase family)